MASSGATGRYRVQHTALGDERSSRLQGWSRPCVSQGPPDPCHMTSSQDRGNHALRMARYELRGADKRGPKWVWALGSISCFFWVWEPGGRDSESRLLGPDHLLHS